ncbi:MAG: hypothetical protein K2Q32_09625, partial [Alphaproteobacteria bacterium]|nr:hypothetical protein [Alphaproteobacteria bacterium]
MPALKNLEHAWFKRKGYLHFDKSLVSHEAEKYVTNPGNISKHSFSPLIHYQKISIKVQRDKIKEAKYKESGKTLPKPKLKITSKPRDIFYTSHVDGYIYSYYTYLLHDAYEAFLKQNSLTSNVIAYRPIQKNGVKLYNA